MSAGPVDYHAVFDAAPTPYLVLAPDLTILDANRAYLASVDRTRDALIGRPVFEAFPGNPNDTDADGGVAKVRRSFEDARDSGRSNTMPLQEYDIPAADGQGFVQRFWSLISTPVLDAEGRCTVILQRAEDVTEYVRDRQQAELDREQSDGWRRRIVEAEADLYARGRELEAARAAEAVAVRRFAALVGVALELADAQSVDDVRAIVIDSGLSALGARGGVVVELADLPPDGSTPACVAARTGRPVFLPDRAAARVFGQQTAEVLDATGSRASAALPLFAAHRVIGVLGLGWADPHPMDAQERELLTAFAGQCGQALDRIGIRQAERRAHDTVAGMSEALQRSLLAEPPKLDDLEIVVRYQPAAALAQIGGDWYDAFQPADGGVALVIGDVAGHDREAAAAMAQVRNLLRGIAHTSASSPAAVLSSLDLALRDLQVAVLATAVLVTILDADLPDTVLPDADLPDDNGAARSVRWSNAGHPMPVLVRVDPAGVPRAEFLPADRPDLLLGVRPGVTRHDHRTTLRPGDTLLLYTDGLVERRDASIDAGMQALLDQAGELDHLPLEQVCDSILARLGDSRSDDIAMLAVRVRPRPLG